MRYFPHLYRCRQPGNVVAHRVEQAGWDKVYSGLQNPELLGIALDYEGREAQDASTRIHEAIQRIEHRLSELDLQSQRILRLYATGKWRESDLDLQRTVIAEEREALEAELRERHEQKARQIDYQDLLHRVSTIAETAAHLPISIQSMALDEYRQAMALVRLIVQRVTLDGQGKLVIDLAIGEVQPRGESGAQVLNSGATRVAEPSQGSTQSS